MPSAALDPWGRGLYRPRRFRSFARLPITRAVFVPFQGDPLVVTLRSSTSHLVLTLAATCVHLAAWANEEPSAPPRTLMRLPGWIESLGEDQA